MGRKTGLKVFFKSLQTSPCFPSFLCCGYIVFVPGPKKCIFKKHANKILKVQGGAGVGGKRAKVEDRSGHAQKGSRRGSGMGT